MGPSVFHLGVVISCKVIHIFFKPHLNRSIIIVRSTFNDIHVVMEISMCFTLTNPNFHVSEQKNNFCLSSVVQMSEEVL